MTQRVETSMPFIEFFCEGTPIPQGSKTIRRHGDKAWLTDVNSKKLKDWRTDIADLAELHMGGLPPLDEAVQVGVTFYMPRPASVIRSEPSVKPDVDKLLRAVFDSLGPVVVDDSRIVSVIAEKKYETDAVAPGAFITIWRSK